MSDAGGPSLERLSTGRSPVRSAVIVSAALLVMVAIAIVGRVGGASRFAGSPAATVDSRAAAADSSATDHTTSEFARFRVLSPEPGASRRNDGSIRIAARGAEPHQIVRAAVTSQRRDLGAGTMQSNARGVIEGSVHLLPIDSALSARLQLYDAVGGHLLADVDFMLDPGLPVSIMSPSGSQSTPPTDRLWVFGTTLSDVMSVRLRVLERTGLVVVERTIGLSGTDARGRAFSTELSLPQERQRQLLWLDVTWSGGPAEHADRNLRIPVRVSSSREDGTQNEGTGDGTAGAGDRIAVGWIAAAIASYRGRVPR